MKWLCIWLFCFFSLVFVMGCIDSSVSTEFHNSVVYQFPDVKVGEVIPKTTITWTMEDTKEVMRRVDINSFSWWSLGNCEAVYLKRRAECYAVRLREIPVARDRYIRELQALGIR